MLHSAQSSRAFTAVVDRAVAVVDAVVLRGSEEDGLLMLMDPGGELAGSGAHKLLERGDVVRHNGGRWVCTFQLDKFWFASPVDSLPAQFQSRWSGHLADLVNGLCDFDAAVHALQGATPTQAERAALSEGISTGLIAVDVLAPIGRGQSMLICGANMTGKSTIASEIIHNALERNQFDKVIRCCTAPSVPHPAEVSELARDDAFAELAPPLSPASPALVASLFTAVAAGEEIRNAGGHALVVLDTIAPLTESWELALTWVQAHRGCAVDQDLVGAQRRALFASLMERAAALSEGGGSLTLLVLLETVGARAAEAAASRESTYTLADFQGRKSSELERLQRLADRGVAITESRLVTIGIAAPSVAAGSDRVSVSSEAPMQRAVSCEAMRELQSLSDGQIVLCEKAAAVGAFPALLPGATLSRFGLGSAESSAAGSSRAARDVRPAALQAVAAHLRTQLALEEEARFRPEAAMLDDVQSAQMAGVKAALLQGTKAHLLPEEMAVLLLAACSGALESQLPKEEVAIALGGGGRSPLLQHLRSSVPWVLRAIMEESSRQTASGAAGLPTAAVRELDVAVRLFVALRRAEILAKAAGNSEQDKSSSSMASSSFTTSSSAPVA